MPAIVIGEPFLLRNDSLSSPQETAWKPQVVYLVIFLNQRLCYVVRFVVGERFGLSGMEALSLIVTGAKPNLAVGSIDSGGVGSGMHFSDSLRSNIEKCVFCWN